MKFASINIERSKHLRERVLPFLRREQPDVLCLQELCEHDLPVLEDLFGQRVHYAPMTVHPLHNTEEGKPVIIGVGLVARQSLHQEAIYFYRGRATPVPTYLRAAAEGTNITPVAEALNQVIVAGTINGVRFSTTHLEVTLQGQSTPQQLALAERVVAYTDWEASQYGNTLLCGDFNAPRGGATWAKLAEWFTDNIPAHYTTSLDGILHRAGPLPYVVDGIFSKGNLQVKNVQLHTGVSDHCAVTGEVELL